MPESARAPATFSARPVFTVDGNEESSLSSDVSELVIEETADGMSRCEATFANVGPTSGTLGYPYFDRRILDFGKSIAVHIGAGEVEGEVFAGRITALEGRFPRERAPEVLVLAEDALQDLRMTRRTRTFEDSDDATVFRRIASDHGLTADVDVTGPTYRVLCQLNQSDLAFAHARARAIGAQVWVADGALTVRKRSDREGADLTLAYNAGLLELSVTADLAGQATGLTVSGWDVRQKRAVAHRASETSLSAELGSDESGAATLRASLGEREESVVHEMPLDAVEAQAIAEAAFARSARRFVTGQGVAEPDARLRVGATLRLEGLGLFNGSYFVDSVRHVFDGEFGLRTFFTVERPGLS